MDWILKAPGLEVRVLAGGSKIAVKSGPAPGDERLIENRPGEPVEMKI